MTNTIRDMRPSMLGKLATAIQVATLGLVLLADVLSEPGIQLIKRWGLRATVVFTVLSGMHYMYLVGQRLRSPAANRPGAAA
jgi:cardiolipin synthase (CMP-forming)